MGPAPPISRASPTLRPHRRRTGWESLGLTVLTAVGVGFPAAPTAATGQEIPTLAGVVVDGDSGSRVADVEVALVGFATRITDSLGWFAFRDIPPGTHLLRLRHLAYGTHEESVTIGPDGRRVTVEISQTAIELGPLLVEVESADRRNIGYQQNRITRQDLARFEGTTMDLGDVLAYQVPGIRVRRSTVLMGLPYCIEFRGATGGSFISRPRDHRPRVQLPGGVPGWRAGVQPVLPVPEPSGGNPRERRGRASLGSGKPIRDRCPLGSHRHREPSSRTAVERAGGASRARRGTPLRLDDGDPTPFGEEGLSERIRRECCGCRPGAGRLPRVHPDPRSGVRLRHQRLFRLGHHGDRCGRRRDPCPGGGRCGPVVG